jgi:Lrp/AsnC family transcriptional regulator of lysine biosynthesis
MDELDFRILDELKKNAKQGNVEIAKKLGVSEGTVRKRIKEMEEGGVIKRYTVMMNTSTGFSAFVLIRSRPNVQTSAVVQRIRKVKGVETVYETSGEWDVILRVSCGSAEEFNNVIEKIRAVQGVVETRSLVVLKITM